MAAAAGPLTIGLVDFVDLVGCRQNRPIRRSTKPIMMRCGRRPGSRECLNLLSAEGVARRFTPAVQTAGFPSVSISFRHTEWHEVLRPQCKLRVYPASQSPFGTRSGTKFCARSANCRLPQCFNLLSAEGVARSSPGSSTKKSRWRRRVSIAFRLKEWHGGRTSSPRSG